MRRILFVCTGNICRSPLAEAVLRHKLAERGLEERFTVDSAGTVSDHLGQQLRSAMRKTAAAYGVSIDHRARLVVPADFAAFDLLIGMDDSHITTLQSMKDGRDVEVRKMREFDPKVDDEVDLWTAPDVPDPWYGGMRGFEDVFEMIDRSCDVLVRRLVEELVIEDASTVEEALERIGGKVTRQSRVAGGCIANGAWVELDDGSRWFVKRSRRSRATRSPPKRRACGRSTRLPGRVFPRSWRSGPDRRSFIVMEWIEPGARGGDFAERFGRSLARMHRHRGARRFGFDRDNYIGSTPQPNGGWIPGMTSSASAGSASRQNWPARRG